MTLTDLLPEERTREEQFAICQSDRDWSAQRLKEGVRKLRNELEDVHRLLSAALEQETTEALCAVLRDHGFDDLVGHPWGDACLVWHVGELYGAAESYESNRDWIRDLEETTEG